MWTLHNISQLQAWHGWRLDFSHICILGSLAYMHIPKPLRTKVGSKLGGDIQVFKFRKYVSKYIERHIY